MAARQPVRFIGVMPDKPNSRRKPDPRAASTVDVARGTNITAIGELT